MATVQKPPNMGLPWPEHAQSNPRSISIIHQGIGNRTDRVVPCANIQAKHFSKPSSSVERVEGRCLRSMTENADRQITRPCFGGQTAHATTYRSRQCGDVGALTPSASTSMYVFSKRSGAVEIKKSRKRSMAIGFLGTFSAIVFPLQILVF